MEKVPLGWIINGFGQPTTNPEEFLKGGALLPFGGHKGYSLALLMDILGGILTGTGFSSEETYESSNGVLLMALNIESFMSVDTFKKRVDTLFRKIKSTPTTADGGEVLIPGELEFRTETKRLREGIFISEKLWKDLTDVAEGFGLNLEQALK